MTGRRQRLGARRVLAVDGLGFVFVFIIISSPSSIPPYRNRLEVLARRGDSGLAARGPPASVSRHTPRHASSSCLKYANHRGAAPLHAFGMLGAKVITWSLNFGAVTGWTRRVVEGEGESGGPGRGFQSTAAPQRESRRRGNFLNGLVLISLPCCFTLFPRRACSHQKSVRQNVKNM